MRLFFLLCSLSIMCLESEKVEAQVEVQEYRADILQNCQLETRNFAFYRPLSFFRRWVEGRSDIRNQKILAFVPSYVVDTTFLQRQIEKVRKSLPADFFKMKFTGSLLEGPTGTRYNNSPDEQAIWFEMVFSKEDKAGKRTTYAAFRITFDGNDARIEEQRMDPKITNIQFVFDKDELAKLGERLKSSSP